MALAVVGCGGNSGDITVNGKTLSIKDQGYFYSDSHDFCPAGGAGQMMLDFVDYNFICDPGNPPQKDPEAPHTELRIILTQGALPDHLTHPNMSLPYDSTTTPNCDTGPGDVIIGEFLYYANGHADTVPMITYATSAHLQFTDYDATKAKPNKGTFDLKFGATEVKQSFTIYSCGG